MLWDKILVHTSQMAEVLESEKGLGWSLVYIFNQPAIPAAPPAIMMSIPGFGFHGICHPCSMSHTRA